MRHRTKGLGWRGVPRRISEELVVGKSEVQMLSLTAIAHEARDPKFNSSPLADRIVSVRHALNITVRTHALD